MHQTAHQSAHGTHHRSSGPCPLSWVQAGTALRASPEVRPRCSPGANLCSVNPRGFQQPHLPVLSPPRMPSAGLSPYIMTLFGLHNSGGVNHMHLSPFYKQVRALRVYRIVPNWPSREAPSQTSTGVDLAPKPLLLLTYWTAACSLCCSRTCFSWSCLQRAGRVRQLCSILFVS